MLRRPLVAATVVMIGVVLGSVIWASGKLSLQGERTVYTAACVGATWEGLRCSGHLVPAERYRFHVDQARSEVRFRLVGGSSGWHTMRGCRVSDAMNWACPGSSEAGDPIATEMSAGRPVAAGATRSAENLRAITKWRWYTLRWGIGSDNGVAVANVSGRGDRGPDLRDAGSAA